MNQFIFKSIEKAYLTLRSTTCTFSCLPNIEEDHQSLTDYITAAVQMIR